MEPGYPHADWGGQVTMISQNYDQSAVVLHELLKVYEQTPLFSTDLVVKLLLKGQKNIPPYCIENNCPVLV